eukprot:jgi/Chlat1/4493/Chrsp29S04433
MKSADADGRDIAVVEKQSSGKQSLQLPSLPPMQLGVGSLQPPKLRVPALKFGTDTVNHILAGTMARTIAQAFVHPIDTIKTRLQAVKPPSKLQRWREKIHTKHIHIGNVNIDNWWYKGPKDIYLGLTCAVIGTIPTALVYFAAYEFSKRQLEKILPPEAGSFVHIGAASTGALTSAFVRVPADTLKHRVQAYVAPGFVEAAKDVVAKKGLRGFYSGFAPTVMRDVPEIAIQFTVYEFLRRKLERSRQVKKLRTWEHLLLGGLAGSGAALCTMPLDLVKTRQQCGLQGSVLSAMRSVVEKDGVGGLWAGLGPRLTQVTIMSAVFFGLFEYCKLVVKPDRMPDDALLLPKLVRKRRDKIWKRQFVYAELLDFKLVLHVQDIIQGTFT